MSGGAAGGSRERLVRSSAAVGLGTLLSRVTGLGRVLVLAYALGKASLADTYNLANSTPNIVYELLLGGILSATLVPLFVDHIEHDDARATSAVFTVTLTVITGLTFVAMAGAPLIARLYSINTSGAEHRAQLAVMTAFVLLFLPQMVFYALTALATAILNAHRRFVAAAYAPVLNNIVAAVVLLVFARATSGADWTDVARIRHEVGMLLLLGLGTTAGIVAMGVVLVPAMRAAHVHLRPVLEWRHPAVRTMVRLSGWTIGYVVGNQVSLVVVLLLAKSHGTGNVSAYLYAYTFYQVPHGLLAVSIMTTIGPELARRASARDLPGLRRDFALGLRYLFVAIVPASIAFAVLAQPMVGVLRVGHFSPGDVRVTGDTLQLLAVGLVPFSVYLYTLRAFYALHDTRTPFVLNTVENAANVALAFALVPTLGVQGLALAWSGAYLVAAVSTLVVLRRRVGETLPPPVVATAARALAGAAALALVAAPLAGVIGSNGPRRSLVAASAGLVAGGLAYVLVLLALRSGELGELLGILRPAAAPSTRAPGV